MARICLLSPAPPASNPRLVREADALAEAGHGVEVLTAAAPDWTEAATRVLMSSRSWSHRYVGGHPASRSWEYRLTRVRNGLSRRLAPVIRRLHWAVARVTPELAREASRIHCDLYIAHYPGALAAAVIAASRTGATVGYDAEDFLPGIRPAGIPPTQYDLAAEEVERRYLPRCTYVTAASPGIARAYADVYGIPEPTPVLNVPPPSERPPAFRATFPSGPLTLYWFSQVIGPGRGLEDVIGAMSLLSDQDIELHLLGNWDPHYQPAFLSHCVHLGVSQARIVSHPPAPPDEMVSIAALYDVGLAVETAETVNRDIAITNKLFTYILAGNALVATATEGQRAITHTIAGAFCYQAGDVASLAAQLRAWHDDREQLDRDRRSAWRAGTERYNWGLEKQRFLGVVSAALNRSAHV